MNVSVVGVVSGTLFGDTTSVPDPSGANPTDTCGELDNDVSVPPEVDASLAANAEITCVAGVEALLYVIVKVEFAVVATPETVNVLAATDTVPAEAVV